MKDFSNRIGERVQTKHDIKMGTVIDTVRYVRSNTSPELGLLYVIKFDNGEITTSDESNVIRMKPANY